MMLLAMLASLNGSLVGGMASARPYPRPGGSVHPG